MMMKRWSVEEVEVDQGKQQRSQSGWQDSHSADQYQSYVRTLLKSPSVAEPPPAAAPAPAPPPAPAPRTTTTTSTTITTNRQVEWNNRTSDYYHAHVNRMLRSPSIVDAPPYPKVYTLFKNDTGRLN